MPKAHVVGRLTAAGGNEIESGKLASKESSAALAINTFGWFVERPHLLPVLPGLAHVGPALWVEVEYCARFPWAAGRHPWLDAAVATSTHLIGVESKRYEPYRDRKKVSLSSTYDQPVWGENMQPFERMRDRLRSGEVRFEYLDAAQLVKHAFGLVTDGRRRALRPALHYMYAEPEHLRGSLLTSEAFEAHRREIDQFSAFVSGAEVEFAASSYREWFAHWDRDQPALTAHAQAILTAFQP